MHTIRALIVAGLLLQGSSLLRGAASAPDVAQQIVAAGTDVEVAKNDLLKPAPVAAALQYPAKIETMEEMAQFMRKFKQDEIVSIERNVRALEKLLDAADQKLEAAAGDKTKLMQNLVYKAKVAAALADERMVLSAVRAMQERMVRPADILSAGYKTSKETIDLLHKVSRDAVAQKLEILLAARRQVLRDKGASQSAYAEALSQARDALANYYGLIMNLYGYFQQMLEGLWHASAGMFVRQKESSITEMENALKEMAKAALASRDAIIDLTPAETGAVEEMLVEKDARVAAIASAIKGQEQQEAALRLKYEARIKKYRQQKTGIWQDGGQVIGKQELIAQRKIDWQDAQADERDARVAKGNVESLIQTYVSYTSQMADMYEKDQGRLDLEAVLRSGRSTLEEVITRIRGIDESAPDQTDASVLGVKTLFQEAALFKTHEYTKSQFMSTMATGIGKQLAFLKEMKPLVTYVQACFSTIVKMCPEFEAVVPCVQVVMNRLMPGFEIGL